MKTLLYKTLRFALLSILFLNCASVKASNENANPLLKSFKTAVVPSDKGEGISISVIRQNDFDLDKLDSLDLSKVGCGPLSQRNTFHLTSGNALFNPKKDIIVLTNLAKISIGGGSAVCIFKPEAGVVSIYNLHCGGEKKVIVNVGAQAFKLSPGMQVTACYKSIAFDTIKPAAQIAYRNLNKRDLGQGICIYKAEFSIPSAIAHINSLKTMLSSRNKDEQKLADQLVKNSIVLDYMSDSNETYSLASKAKSTQVAGEKTYSDHNEHLSHNSLVQ